MVKKIAKKAINNWKNKNDKHFWYNTIQNIITFIIFSAWF